MTDSAEYKGSLAERALKRRRMNAVEAHNCYVDISFIIPTSNLCERLFSKAGYALNDSRQGTLPAHFEALLLVYAYSSLWGIETDFTKLSKDWQ